MRRLFILLLATSALFALASRSAHATPTPTEATAVAAAEHDHTAYTLGPEELAKARHLHTVQVLTYFGGALWSIVSIVLVLQLGIAARLRNVAVNLTKNRWGQCFIFFLEFLIVSTLLDLPLSLYRHHVGLAYGLSVQSWLSWFGDLAKTFALTYVFGGLGVMLLFYLIRKFPRRWWLWLWFPTMAIVLITTYISPWLIDPLFNSFEPLQRANPALVAEMQKVVARAPGIDLPPDRMFLMKASDKVTTLNAYVTGFGASKRVVIWDTLLTRATPDEISFIFGHEMGHYVLGHVLNGIFVSFFGILAVFFIGFHLFQWLLRRFGKKWRIPSQDNLAALYVFVLVIGVLGFVAEPVANAYSRSLEHDADIYGQEAMHGIVANPQAVGRQAFQVLGEDSLDDPEPHPFFDFWTGTHPPIWFRAAFATHYDPWAPGNNPKYFRK